MSPALVFILALAALRFVTTVLPVSLVSAPTVCSRILGASASSISVALVVANRPEITTDGTGDKKILTNVVIPMRGGPLLARAVVVLPGWI